MIRFFFRFLATLALAVAVIMAVLDATRSIAASALVLTPLSVSWEGASPATLDGFRGFVDEKMGSWLWDPVILSVLNQPGFAVFLAVALLLFAIGRRPGRFGDFAAET